MEVIGNRANRQFTKNGVFGNFKFGSRSALVLAIPAWIYQEMGELLL